MMNYAGYTIEVTVRKNCKQLILRCRDGRLFLSIPPRVSKKKVEEFLASRTDWMRDALERNSAPLEKGDPVRLRALVQALLPAWEERMGVKASEIRYREMVSRWGSCQVKTGKITLNARLAAKSDACVEYVLVHELCHLLHPNHSKAFYQTLSRFLPDWPERRVKLNEKKP